MFRLRYWSARILIVILSYVFGTWPLVLSIFIFVNVISLLKSQLEKSSRSHMNAQNQPRVAFPRRGERLPPSFRQNAPIIRQHNPYNAIHGASQASLNSHTNPDAPQSNSSSNLNSNPNLSALDSEPQSDPNANSPSISPQESASPLRSDSNTNSPIPPNDRASNDNSNPLPHPVSSSFNPPTGVHLRNYLSSALKSDLRYQNNPMVPYPVSPSPPPTYLQLLVTVLKDIDEP